MKRALFDTVAVLPFESGSIVPRGGYESAILAVTVATGTKASVSVEHCDTEDGSFETVADSRLLSTTRSMQAAAPSSTTMPPPTLLPISTSTWWDARSISKSPSPAEPPRLWPWATPPTTP